MMEKKKAKQYAKTLSSLPKKLRIGPYDYSVELSTEPLFIEGDRVEKIGMCWPQMEQIKICSKHLGSSTSAVGVLLHEAMHGIWRNQNLGSKAKEEDAILGMETGLLQLFQDNPGFLSWIQKGIKNV